MRSANRTSAPYIGILFSNVPYSAVKEGRYLVFSASYQLLLPSTVTCVINTIAAVQECTHVFRQRIHAHMCHTSM